MADAATTKPTLVDDEDLLPRDNSGGAGFKARTAEWGDGGEPVGGGFGPGMTKRKKSDGDEKY